MSTSPMQMDPAMIHQLKQLAFDYAHGNFITRSMHFAIYTLAVYDWLLCLNEELPILRTAGLSPAKVGYTLCRYWPLLTHPVTLWVQAFDHGSDFCQRHFKLPLYLIVLNFAFAASVLTVRLYAFTGCNRIIAGFLITCLISVATYQIWAVSERVALVPFGSGCYPVEKIAHGRFLAGYFFSPLLFDCVAMIVFVGHAMTTFKFNLSLTTGFTRHFLREGFNYFILISLVNFANSAASFQKANVSYSGVAVALSMLLPNIFACRLVINMRRAASRQSMLPGGGGGTTESSASYSFKPARQSHAITPKLSVVPSPRETLHPLQSSFEAPSSEARTVECDVRWADTIELESRDQSAGGMFAHGAVSLIGDSFTGSNKI